MSYSISNRFRRWSRKEGNSLKYWKDYVSPKVFSPDEKLRKENNFSSSQKIDKVFRITEWERNSLNKEHFHIVALVVTSKIFKQYRVLELLCHLPKSFKSAKSYIIIPANIYKFPSLTASVVGVSREMSMDLLTFPCSFHSCPQESPPSLGKT